MNEVNTVETAPTLNGLMETIATEVATETTAPVVVVSESLPVVSETVLTVPETVVPETAVETVLPITVIAETLKAESPVKRKGKKKEKAKRKPGRPPVYNGTDRRIVCAALKKHGLTKGIEFLAKERNLKISMTLARAVAAENELTFSRGRPKIAA